MPSGERTTAVPPPLVPEVLPLVSPMPEGPVRHGLSPKCVDARPGQAGRLLPKRR
jgi:hypothetical protein